MEGKGSFPLHYHTARPPGRATYWRPLCIYLERGHGADGRTKERGERRTEGKKVAGGERGLDDVTEESNREERSGSEGRGEGKANQQSFFFPSLPASLTSCPALPLLSPPFPCGASFVLLLFLRANYIIYDAVHPRKEIHFGEGS